MEQALLYINQIPPEYFLLGLFFFMLLTCMGCIPSHTDLLLLASALIASNGKFPFFGVFAVILSAMLIGENTMFFVGHKFGSRIFNIKFFARIMPVEKRDLFRRSFLQFPNRFLLALRMSPVLRPYFYLSTGSLGLSHKTFFKYHLKWTVSYVVTVYTVCYFGSRLFIDKLNFPPIYGFVAAFFVWFMVLRWVRSGMASVQVTNTPDHL